MSLFFAFTTVGCAASGDHFRVTVVNSGHSSVFGASVSGGGFRRNIAELPDGIAGTTSFVPEDKRKVPDQFIVKWRAHNGGSHHVVINLEAPDAQIAAARFGVPKNSQWWHIVVAYLDDTVSSAWVLFDERYKQDPHFFGRQALYGGDVKILLRAHLLTPDLIGKVPRYTPGSVSNSGMRQ